MRNWTKLHILQAIARYSPALYVIGGGAVTATALTISVLAAGYLAAIFGVIGLLVWSEYERAQHRVWLDQHIAEGRAMREETAKRISPEKTLVTADNYGRHSRI